MKNISKKDEHTRLLHAYNYCIDRLIRNQPPVFSLIDTKSPLSAHSALGCVMQVLLSIFGILLLVAIVGLVVYFVWFHNKKPEEHKTVESSQLIQMIYDLATQSPVFADGDK